MAAIPGPSREVLLFTLFLFCTLSMATTVATAALFPTRSTVYFVFTPKYPGLTLRFWLTAGFPRVGRERGCQRVHLPLSSRAPVVEYAPHSH